jgi:hypothetical protein
MDELTQNRAGLQRPVALRRVWRRIVLLLSLLAVPVFTAGQPRLRLEYEVKAAFLLNFAKFVEWPAPGSSSSLPISLCIVGDDPFGSALDQIIDGETIAQRALAVKRIPPMVNADCNMAFVGGTEKDIPKVLAVFPKGVLTVGEGSDFLRHGGMIAFAIDNRRVRFDINQTAVRNAGLSVSSRLLRVARSVTK